MEIIGNIIISAGVVFILFGVIGIFKFKDFYLRMLVTTKIDTVGALTILIGVVVKHGFSFFSLKILLLLCLMVILNPLASHFLAGSAYLSGHKIDEPPVSGDRRRSGFEEDKV